MLSTVAHRGTAVAYVRTPMSWRHVRLGPLQATVPSNAATQKLRKAISADIPVIRQRLFEEKMNPLSIKPENFTVVEGENGELIAFAQLEQVDATQSQPTYEFRSLVVRPDFRGQGIGSNLLQYVVSACAHDIYLTTLAQTTPFYEKAGFRVVSPKDIPRFLWFEFAAGTVVARLAVNAQLVVMHRPRQ